MADTDTSAPVADTTPSFDDLPVEGGFETPMQTPTPPADAATGESAAPDATTKDETPETTADADLEELSDEPTPDGEAEKPTDFVELDGKRYDRTELAELVSKGQDYTAKTQQLAAERREHEQTLATWNGLITGLEKSPETARQVLDLLAQHARERHGEAFEATRFDEADLSDEGKALHQSNRALMLQNQSLKGELDGLKTQVAELKTFLDKHQSVLADTSLRQVAEPAAQQLQRDYRVRVSPDDVAKAMKATGLTDPIKAFQLHNIDRLTRLAERRAVAATQKPRDVPTGGTNAFDIGDMTVDEIARRAQAGQIVVPDVGR